MKQNVSPRWTALTSWLALALLMLLTSGCSSVSTPPAVPPLVVDCVQVPPLSDAARPNPGRTRNFLQRYADFLDSLLVTPTPSSPTPTSVSGSASPGTTP